MKNFFRFFALALLALGQPAGAAGKFYTQQEFDTLAAEGKTIIVHIHADWCGTCKAQDVQLEAAMRSPEFKDVTFFEVSFDVQRKTVKFFNAKVQSTIILYQHGRETARAVAARDPAELQEFLRRALH